MKKSSESHMKRLSIIIVTYNSERDIYDCLASVFLYNDLAREELEVIIVDNNSADTDTMFAKIQKLYGEDVILIRNSRNGGYGQGNNVGIRHATAPVCLVMNPDVRMIEAIFKTATEAFEKDCSLCLYGIKQKLSQAVLSMSSFACTRMMNGYAFTLLDGFCNRRNLFFPQFMYFQGSCFFLNREKFIEVGMFDEDNFMYGEEDDITYRLRQRFGCHASFNPNLHYLHLALKRAPNLDYELKMLEANAALNQKKGHSRRQTLTDKLRNVRLRLWREQLKALLGKKNEPLYRMLSDFKAHLISTLAEMP